MLALTYSQVSESRILQLRCQFQEMKRNNKKVLNYLAELQMVTDQLTVIGEPMSDKDMVCQALVCLGQEYKLFCISFEVHPRLPTFKELKALLLQYESKYVSTASPEDTYDVMFAHNTAGPTKDVSLNLLGQNRAVGFSFSIYRKGILLILTNTTQMRNHRVPTCFLCNKRGHIKANCWFTPQNKNRRSS